MGEEREEVTKVEKSWIWERRDWRRSRVVGWRRMRSRATGVGAVKEEKRRRGKWEKQSKRTRKEKTNLRSSRSCSKCSILVREERFVADHRW